MHQTARIAASNWFDPVLLRSRLLCSSVSEAGAAAHTSLRGRKKKRGGGRRGRGQGRHLFGLRCRLWFGCRRSALGLGLAGHAISSLLKVLLWLLLHALALAHAAGNSLALLLVGALRQQRIVVVARVRVRTMFDLIFTCQGIWLGLVVNWQLALRLGCHRRRSWLGLINFNWLLAGLGRCLLKAPVVEKDWSNNGRAGLSPKHNWDPGHRIATGWAGRRGSATIGGLLRRGVLDLLVGHQTLIRVELGRPYLGILILHELDVEAPVDELLQLGGLEILADQEGFALCSSQAQGRGERLTGRTACDVQHRQAQHLPACSERAYWRRCTAAKSRTSSVHHHL